MPIRDLIWTGTRFETIDSDTIDSKDSSAFSLVGHTHDYLGPAGNWKTNAGQDLLCHNKRALVGMTNGQLHLGYGGDFTDIRCGNNFKIYHEGNKPTVDEIGAVSSSGGTYNGTYNLQRLTLTDYGTPFECSQYIDFHQVGTGTDYSVRLTGTEGALACSGTFSATKVFNAVWNDYAELFEKEDSSVEAGDILAWGETGVLKANKENVSTVVGVYSDTYGHLLGGEEGNSEDDNLKTYAPVGLAGRVYVKVKGTIKKGDLITVSDIPGVGTKAEKYIPGTIIGKALESYSNEEIKRIQMLIMNI